MGKAETRSPTSGIDGTGRVNGIDGVGAGEATGEGQAALASVVFALPRNTSTACVGGARFTGPNGMIADESTGAEKAGLDAASSLFPRDASASGAVGEGLGDGIGAISCTCKGLAAGAVRIRGFETAKLGT